MDAGSTLTDEAAALRLAELAKRHRRAGRGGMAVVNMLGGQVESAMARLPRPVPPAGALCVTIPGPARRDGEAAPTREQVKSIQWNRKI